MSNYNFLFHSLSLRPSVSVLVTVPLFIVFTLTSIYVARHDLRHHEIPNWFTYGIILSGLVLAPLLYSDWGTHYIVAGVTLLVFILLAELSGGGVGYGDVKLNAGLALYYSYLIIPITVFSSLLAIVAGVVVAKRTGQSIRKTPVPMAPSILAVTIIITLVAYAR